MDVSGSSTRRKYQVFVTGGIGPGITSSLFQTVYDQDFTLQTANPIFDVTFGLRKSTTASPNTIVDSSKTGVDAAGKLLFPSSSVQMREKIDVYRQFASLLLGDADGTFVAPVQSTTSTDQIDAAFFIAFKRLFHRDQVKRETFAMKWYKDAPTSYSSPNYYNTTQVTFESGPKIYTDVGSSAARTVTFGGNVGSIVDSSDPTTTVGLMFYDHGIGVFDFKKMVNLSDKARGIIHGMNAVGAAAAANNVPAFSPGQTLIGYPGSENVNALFVPDFVVSGSIDNIVDHICGCRFSSGSYTAMTFQNITNINSTLVFCRANADEFNYSSNPTFKDSNSRITVIDQGQETTQMTFTFITSVGLYDANGNLLAVAKLSRPVEKSPERDLSLRLRLDF